MESGRWPLMIKIMKKLFVFHPFGFAVFPILFIYVHNPAGISPGEIIIPLGIVIGFAGAATLLLRFFVASHHKRALTQSTFLLLLFSYGHAVRAIRRLGFPDGFKIGPEGAVFALWCILFAMLTYLGLRTRRNLQPVTKILNIIALLLVAMQVIVGGNMLLSAPPVTETRPIVYPHLPLTAKLPDIYYIIVDGYARGDVLREIYDYDNREFLSFLRARGFYVADRSKANYCQTPLSMGSSLNLDYLQKLMTFDKTSHDRQPLVWLLHNNSVFKFLRHYGYSIVAFASGYVYTEFVTADYYLTPGMTLSELDNAILSTTPIPFIMRLGKTQYDFHRERMNYILNKLPHVNEGTSPRMIMAHIAIPHPPFVFGPNGEPVARKRLFNFSDGSHYYNEGGTPAEYLQGYRNQLSYLDRRLRTMITKLLDTAGKEDPPIIILQADHGPGLHLDWDWMPATDLKERMSILNAYYFPYLKDNPLYPEITPVNTFRILFNKYFGTNYPLLPDRNYFSIINRPYHFFEVTNPDSLPPYPGDMR